jgi:ADP-heptose:LPS heptosyltransferase
MEFRPENALIIMTHVKVGDFLVITPHLRRLQEFYPSVTIAVPNLLYEIYLEQKIFNRFIANKDAKNLTTQQFSSVLNLSFPLLTHLKIEESHFRLKGEYFFRPQHVFRSYAEALLEFFPDMPLDAKKAPYFNFELDELVFNKWRVEPFRYFTVHSGSDFAAKNWPAENFEKLAEKLLEENPTLQCLGLVGPCDQPLFQNRQEPERYRTIKDDLRNVAHLLAGSLFHVDNDSGIHHLAGAADVPSITVFGATGPGSWSSLTERNFIHWGAPNCPNPCEGSRLADCSDRVCLSSIKVEHLRESAQTILSAYSDFA